MTEQPQQNDTVQRHSLRLSGVSYLFGDAALFTSGMLKAAVATNKGQARSEAFAGAAWGVGGLGAALFGNPSAEKQLEILAHRLEKHLITQGATVSDAVRERSDLLRSGNTVWGSIDRFCSEHPSEILNGVYAIGAAPLLVNSLRVGKYPAASMGALVLGGALCGLFIKEDKHAPERAKDGNMLQKAAAWVQEQPLRASSGLYMANNLFTFWNARQDHQAYAGTHFPGGMKPYWFSYLTTASYVLANSLLFLSPRNQIEAGGFTDAQMAQLEQAAVEIIAVQPAATREALLKETARYLSQQKLVVLPAEQVAAHLHARVNHVLMANADIGTTDWRARYEAQKQQPGSVALG